MEQRSSTDEKWVTYVFILFVYTLAVVSDWLSAMLFFLLVLQLAGLLPRYLMFLLVEVVLLSDLFLKCPWFAIDLAKLKLDPKCVQMMFSWEPKPILFVYLALHLYNLYLAIYYILSRNRLITLKSWGPLMTQVMVYVLPILMYGLSMITVFWPFRIAWAVLSCLQVLDTFPVVSHVLACALGTCYFFLQEVSPQYAITINNHAIPQQNVNHAVMVILVIMLLFLNVYSNPHPQYKQEPRKSLSASSKRKDFRRQVQEQESKQRIRSIIVIACAIVLCLVTTSLGNIFILFGIYFNLPEFKAKRFFFFVGFGIVCSIVLQPDQVFYFAYLYVVVLIVGQSITASELITYEVHSYSFLLDFYRLYIMLSHVSFLNWLIAISRSSIILTLAICIRVACRYFGYVSVFLGTNDDYGLVEVKLVNIHSISDLFLIVYLVLLRLYSPSKTKTYDNTQVTNILLEYSLVRRLQRGLVILRSFNWVSYILFSLMILSRKPSLYVTLHIFYLVLILICDTLHTEPANPRKDRLLRALWAINFYITIVMIFTRYFYFLKQYDSNSDLMDYLLGILTRYKHWIGLEELTQETEGIRLGWYFLYDGAVLVISWINLYVYNFKVEYQALILNNSVEPHLNQNSLSMPLIANGPVQQSSPTRNPNSGRTSAQAQSMLSPGSIQGSPIDKLEQVAIEQQQEAEQAKYHSIHYFYDSFLKPFDITSYLTQHEFKRVEKVLRDCLLDLCFLTIFVAFYLEKEHVEYIFYFPHFLISAYGYYYRFTQRCSLEFSRKVLGLCCAYGFVTLFSSYLYITFLQMYNQEIPSALVKIYITYILCIVLCFLYKIAWCLPLRMSEVNNKSYHCIIYLCFPFTVESQALWVEILSIFSQFWLAFTMSLFFTNIFSPLLVSTFIHPFIVLYLLLLKIGKQKSQSWLYIVCLISILDIWNYDFFAYFTVLACTVFYAVKTGQKLAQEELEGAYRDEISESVSVNDKPLLEESEEENEDKRWPYYMAYCTIVWMLPQMISLLWMFGVVWLSPSLIATVLIIFSYCNLLNQLLAERETKISQPLLILTLVITGVFFCYQIAQYFYCLLVPGASPYDHSEMGLFLIFDSCFFYLILKKRAVWYVKRGQDAKIYWQEKTELVGELGSQLHNEKKLITLEKYYTSKERLTQKVNKISNLIKQSGKKTYFQSLDNLLKTADPENSYELYTNMLIFLDMHLLKKCFLMLNQYITASKSDNLALKAKTMRREIYRTFNRSFDEAFHRYRIESEREEDDKKKGNEEDKLPEIQLFSKVSRASTINLERINEINQRYKRCFELISKSTEQFNRTVRLMVQHFQIISMMIVIGWNLFGGVYTIPTNILIFGWAIVLENKTTVPFWVFVMSYVCFILIFKQLLAYLPSIYIIDFFFYYHRNDYLYEYLLIVVSVMQITLIKLGGTRFKTYSQRESIYDAFFRAALNKAANGSDMDKEEDFMDIYKNLTEPDNHSFFYRVFSKSRFKPGKDFYPLMASLQLFILMYIFFFYDMMELESKKNRKSIGEILSISQFSSHMVIALFVQIMIMILDRFIISLNLVDEDNQALENFFLSFTFSVTEVKQTPPKKLDKVGIFDFLLVLKYLFHLSLLILINFFVYFYIPSAGLTKSLIPSCSQSECNKSYTYLSIFLILYFAYFLVSGLQIKHGFNRNKCKNVLMEKHNWVNYYTYKAFTAIPFAWEFKKICDWTVTSTALPLFHWMKFEDINARLYQSKCEALMIKMKPLGTPWNKYFLGPIGFILMLLLAFSPFIIYSTVNPFAVKDAVIGARTDIYLRMDGRYDYKFFSTSHATVTELTEQQNFELSLTNQNLFLIKMSKYPDENFLLSQPVVKKLCLEIKDTVQKQNHIFTFVIVLNVIQQEGGESQIEWATKKLTLQELENLHSLLTLQTTSLVVDSFYSPFPGQLPLESILVNSPNQGEYFEVELAHRSGSSSKDIYFYYLTSNKFKVSVGILTFYLTYILVISRLIRFYLTGTVRNILYEGCYLESILILCEAVREARIVENFLQEESFYFELMDIMRHPKALKQITGDFLTFRKKYI